MKNTKEEIYGGQCGQCGEAFSECKCLINGLKKDIDKSEHTDYSPNPLDRLKNKIAREDGFEDWNEATFKLGVGSLMMLVDKVIEQQTTHLTDQIKSMEGHAKELREENERLRRIHREAERELFKKGEK